MNKKRYEEIKRREKACEGLIMFGICGLILPGVMLNGFNNALRNSLFVNVIIIIGLAMCLIGFVLYTFHMSDDEKKEFNHIRDIEIESHNKQVKKEELHKAQLEKKRKKDYNKKYGGWF